MIKDNGNSVSGLGVNEAVGGAYLNEREQLLTPSQLLPCGNVGPMLICPKNLKTLIFMGNLLLKDRQLIQSFKSNLGALSSPSSTWWLWTSCCGRSHFRRLDLIEDILLYPFILYV